MKTLKEAALEIPGILNTGLLQLKDRGMKLPMSLKVTVHSGIQAMEKHFQTPQHLALVAIL